MSAASNRSAINRQKLARQRMRAARGLSIASPETKSSYSHPLQQGAMSPPQEMRVKLLPRIAEYRSKGWIDAEEESDYHQLLSSRPKEFGDTTDQVAVQVEKALDLAKVKHESSKKSAPASTNSRSLFRKETTGSELTLQKKLSHRRKSRMGMTSPEAKNKMDTNERDETSSRRDTIDSKELSIVEAMFGKNEREEKENDDAPTPADTRNERLARARHRRRSGFSPDAVNSKSKNETTTTQQAHVEQQKSKLATAAARRLHDSIGTTESRRSIYHQSSKASQQVSLGEVPTISLSESESTEQQEDVGFQENAAISGSRRSIFQASKASQQVLGGAASLSSEWSSTEQQENVDKGIKKVHPQPWRQKQQVLTEAPVITQAKLESVKNSRQSPQICEPRDLWQKNHVQSEEALRDLFVEMAFFARLGFIQPPSCLHCVYRESIEKTTPDLRCERLVPWRKNANVPIHPHQLDDNIVLVQCHAARSLAQGKGVQKYHWDKIRRQLVCQ